MSWGLVRSFLGSVCSSSVHANRWEVRMAGEVLLVFCVRSVPSRSQLAFRSSPALGGAGKREWEEIECSDTMMKLSLALEVAVGLRANRHQSRTYRYVTNTGEAVLVARETEGKTRAYTQYIVVIATTGENKKIYLTKPSGWLEGGCHQRNARGR